MRERRSDKEGRRDLTQEGLTDGVHCGDDVSSADVQGGKEKGRVEEGKEPDTLATTATRRAATKSTGTATRGILSAPCVSPVLFCCVCVLSDARLSDQISIRFTVPLQLERGKND